MNIKFLLKNKTTLLILAIFLSFLKPEERFEYASKLKVAMENLKKAGERLGKYELEKKYAIAREDYDKAKAKKAQAQQYRQQVYQSLEVEDLLELHGVFFAK